MRPQNTEYAPFYQNYVSRAHGENALETLKYATEELAELEKQIPSRLADYRYAEGKWTVKQLLQHMIDTERVMSFRALWIARNSLDAQPGFEENDWADLADARQRSLKELFAEFDVVRQSTLALFKSLMEQDMEKQGMASGHTVSVRALAYIIAGHQEHHVEILKTRYLL